MDGTESFKRVITQCRSCGKQIVWFKTSAGRVIPVNAESIAPDAGEVFDPDKMTTHFADCTESKIWRKPKEVKSK